MQAESCMCRQNLACAGRILHVQAESCMCRQNLACAGRILHVQAESCMCRQNLVCAGRILHVQAESCMCRQNLVCAGRILYVQAESCMCRQNLACAGRILYVQAESCMCRQNLAWCVENGMAVKCVCKEWEWLSCSNKEEGVAVVAVHKVKQGMAADGGRTQQYRRVAIFMMGIVRHLIHNNKNDIIIQLLQLIYVTVFRKANQLARKLIIAYTRGNNRQARKDANEIKKNKRVILGDEASDWLQIWTVSSSLDVKGNKAIKQKFDFLTNRLVFPNTVTYIQFAFFFFRS